MNSNNNNFVINITKMKPGMPDYTKSIYVYNRSDVEADLIYEVTSFNLLGHTIQFSDNITMTADYLRTTYPFSINLSPSKVILAPNDNLQFDVILSWPYDSQTEVYYKQDAVYEYEPSLPYYRLNAGTYSLYEVANASVYNSTKPRLYFAKDEADTYFGMKCHAYEQNTGNACLSLNLRLIVQQRNQAAVTIYTTDGMYNYIGEEFNNSGATYNTYSAAVAAYGRNYFLKHTVLNNVVTESYVGIVSNNNVYYLRGGGATCTLNAYNETVCNSDSPYYASNKTILASVFGSSNCSENANSEYTCSGSGLTGFASGKGYIWIRDRDIACEVEDDGYSTCGYY